MWREQICPRAAGLRDTVGIVFAREHLSSAARALRCRGSHHCAVKLGYCWCHRLRSHVHELSLPNSLWRICCFTLFLVQVLTTEGTKAVTMAVFHCRVT